MTEFPEDQTGLSARGDLILDADHNESGEGDLIIRTSGVERARITSDGTASGAFAGGGSQTLRVVEVPITFNTASLTTGVAATTLADGEYLLDAAFLISTAWDGTTPLGDLGVATDAAGMFGTFASSAPNGVDMTETSDTGDFTGLVVPRGYQSLAALAALATIGGSPGGPALPPRASGTVHLAVWVTQDGVRGGSSPGAAQGAAVVVLFIAAAA